MQWNVLYNRDIVELSCKEFGISQYTLVENRIKKDFDSFNDPNCYYPYCLLSMIQGFLYPN